MKKGRQTNSKEEQQARNTQHPTSNIQHPMPDVQWRAGGGEGDDSWELREGEGGKRKFDLEERLLEFASAVIDLSEKLPNSRAGNHVAGQLLRSGTSPYPNHGEAEEAESRDDFIHKLKICLKELRETRRWARLVKRKAWAREDATLPFVLAEADELVRIFFSSIQTAKRNALAEKRPSPRHNHYPPPTPG
jgi:four helix bundle protein